MLFVPFKELKMNQNFTYLKDYNTGMGLACSKTIAQVMNGKIKIKHSEPGLTIFTFSIPVKAVNILSNAYPKFEFFEESSIIHVE